MTTDLEISEQMNQAGVAKQKVMDEEARATLENRLKSTGVLTTGPPMDAYDYVGADRDGASLQEEPGEGGGINLPTKHIKNLFFAGRRASNGEVMGQRYDPNGFGDEGHKRLSSSFINTKMGAPPEAMDGLVPLTIEHIQNGGTREDFESPYGTLMVDRAFEFLNDQGGIQTIAGQLDQAPEVSPVDRSIEETEITPADLKADPEWNLATRALSEYYGFEETDDATLTEDGIEEIAAVLTSNIKMAEIMYAIKSGDMPQHVVDSYLYMVSQYDRLSMWNMDILQGATTGIVNDLPLFFAGGGLGTTVVKAAGRQAAIQAFKSFLMNTTKGKVVAGMGIGAMSGGVEEAALGGMEEATRQTLEHGEVQDYTKVWSQTQTRGTQGAIFGAPFGALLSKPGRDGAIQAYHAVTDTIGRAGVSTPMTTQRGSIGTPASNAPKGIPQTIDDLGQPMADTNGDSYYSVLHETAMDNGIIKADETDPAKYLSVLTKRTQAGAIKPYEMEEARLGDFLQSKIAAGEKVSKEEVSDYLWANRPRVNSLVTNRYNWGEEGSEAFGTKQLDYLRQSGAITVMKDNFFTSKRMKDGQWLITNKMDGTSEVTSNPAAFLTGAVDRMVGKMSDDQVVQMIRQYDKHQLFGELRYGSSISGRGSPTIVKGEFANNYQEMRLFIPYNGLDNVDDIASDRFGKNFADLSPAEKKRTENIKGFANIPDKSFREATHYALEHNRLVHVRTQELFTPGGERVLGVNELQSDLHQSLKNAPDDNQSFIDYSTDYAFDEFEMDPVSKQPTAGWVQMTLNRTMQLAQDQGYNKVAFPIDPDMIASIQLWDPEGVQPAVLNFYKNLAKKIKGDKRLAKSWGITSVEELDVASDSVGTLIPQKMLVISFDPTKAPKRKPIYGLSALATTAGATMLGEEQQGGEL